MDILQLTDRIADAAAETCETLGEHVFTQSEITLMKWMTKAEYLIDTFVVQPYMGKAGVREYIEE